MFVNNFPIRASTSVSNGVIYVINDILMNFTQFGPESFFAQTTPSPVLTNNRETSSRRPFPEITSVDVSNSQRRPVIDPGQPSRTFITSTSVQPPTNRIDDILLQKRRQSLVELMQLHPRISRFTQLVNKSNYSRILNSKKCRPRQLDSNL